jgi:hypothetical protein
MSTAVMIQRQAPALGYNPPVEFEAELGRDNRNQANQDAPSLD